MDRFAAEHEDLAVAGDVGCPACLLEHGRVAADLLCQGVAGGVDRAGVGRFGGCVFWAAAGSPQEVKKHVPAGCFVP